MKSHDGNISIYEFGKKICHSTYEHAGTATNSTQEVSTSIIEELLEYKSDFEDLKNCITYFKEFKRRAAEFEESLRHTANITADSVSIHS